MPSIKNNNIQIAKNTFLLYTRMLFVMIVSLYISRVLLKALGVEDFGTYNVVGGVTSLFSFLMSAMSISTQRFLSFELGRGNIEEMTKIFATSIAIHFLIGIVFFVLAETIGLYIVCSFLEIPSGRDVAAHFCYQFTILTMIFHIFAVPFTATVITYEKMNIYAIISIVDILLKLGVAFLISIVSLDRLVIYAALMALESFVVLLIYLFYCKHHFTICKFYISLCSDKYLFKRMLGFTGWNFLGQSAMVVSNQGVNIILNSFAGVVVNAAMGIANQVNSAVMSLVYNFQTAFRPQLTKAYAKGNKDELLSLLYLASKVSFYLVLVVAFPLSLNIDLVLSVWLTSVPQYTSVFCVLILLYSLIESLCGPLFISISATGNIKKYQIMVSTILSLNLFFSYFFLFLGFSLEIVLIVKIIINIVLLLYRMSACRHLVGVDLHLYSLQVLLRLFLMLMLTVVVYFIIIKVLPISIHPFTSIIISMLCTTVSMYLVGLNRVEQKSVIKLCLKLLKKI